MPELENRKKILLIFLSVLLIILLVGLTFLLVSFLLKKGEVLLPPEVPGEFPPPPVGNFPPSPAI